MNPRQQIEWTDENIAILCALWDEGLSTRLIGLRMGVSAQTIQRHADRLGLPRRARQPHKRIDPWERFLELAIPEPNSGCWLWSGYVFPNGYPILQLAPGEGAVRASRFAYTKVKGPIPEGLQLDHLCRTRSCVNPDHLEPVTGRENVWRALDHVGQATHCPRGHAYTIENIRFNATGGRECRTCRNAAVLARYHRNRAQAAAVSQ